VLVDQMGDAEHLPRSQGYELEWNHHIVSFRLSCESRTCRCDDARRKSAEGRYVSELAYLLRVPRVRLSSSYLPNKESLEKWFESADVCQVTKLLEDRFVSMFNHFTPALGTTLAIYVGPLASPVFALSLIAIQQGVETWVDHLRHERQLGETNRKLWEQISSQPFDVKDVGGPGHVQFGEWVRDYEKTQGKHVQQCYGGLTKWMNPETGLFEWVCPTDAYDRMRRLKVKYGV
jgi:hypothetical protein